MKANDLFSVQCLHASGTLYTSILQSIFVLLLYTNAEDTMYDKLHKYPIISFNHCEMFTDINPIDW